MKKVSCLVVVVLLVSCCLPVSITAKGNTEHRELQNWEMEQIIGGLSQPSPDPNPPDPNDDPSDNYSTKWITSSTNEPVFQENARVIISFKNPADDDQSETQSWSVQSQRTQTVTGSATVAKLFGLSLGTTTGTVETKTISVTLLDGWGGRIWQATEVRPTLLKGTEVLFNVTTGETIRELQIATASKVIKIDVFSVTKYQL